MPGTEEVVPADTIILAVGQSADLGFLEESALSAQAPGGVEVDPDAADLRSPHLGGR